MGYIGRTAQTQSEGKFTCKSEDLWSLNTRSVNQGDEDPYVIRLPKSKFAVELLEPNNGYVEPCFTMETISLDPEKLPTTPNATSCLASIPYFCKAETKRGKAKYINYLNFHL